MTSSASLTVKSTECKLILCLKSSLFTNVSQVVILFIFQAIRVREYCGCAPLPIRDPRNVNIAKSVIGG